MTNRQIPNLPVVKQDETYEKCRHDGVRFVTPDGTKSRCPCGEILNEPFNPTLPPQTFTGVELTADKPTVDDEAMTTQDQDQSAFEVWYFDYLEKRQAGKLPDNELPSWKVPWKAGRAELVERQVKEMQRLGGKVVGHSGDRMVLLSQVLAILNEEAAK